MLTTTRYICYFLSICFVCLFCRRIEGTNGRWNPCRLDHRLLWRLSMIRVRGHSTTTWTEFFHFLTPPPAWTVFLPWAWTKTNIFWPPPPSSCPRSYWMAPYMNFIEFWNYTCSLFLITFLWKKLPFCTACNFSVRTLGYFLKKNEVIFSPWKHKKTGLKRNILMAVWIFFSVNPTAQNGPRMKIHIGNVFQDTPALYIKGKRLH